jgi:hypothetical protein
MIVVYVMFGMGVFDSIFNNSNNKMIGLFAGIFIGITWPLHLGKMLFDFLLFNDD